MKLYKLKLLLLALLGYAYIFLILALLLTLVLLLFGSILAGIGLSSFIIQFEIAFIIVTAAVLRSLWVRLRPPLGLKLAEPDHPLLFEMIDQIKRAVRGPNVYAVVLTEDFNACVVSVPRLGLFGWPRHYLLIGLPLMVALSPPEFRAAIAHEMGHLAGAFSSGQWILMRTTLFSMPHPSQLPREQRRSDQRDCRAKLFTACSSTLASPTECPGRT